MTQHPRLMSPLKLRDHTLRNRIVFGAHTANMSDQGDARAAVREVSAGTRAWRGAAMVVNPVPVHRTGVLTRGNILHSDDRVIPAYRIITDEVKDAGAVIIQQLYHVGAHGDPDLSFAPHWSPSGGPSYHDSDGSHAMTGAEVEELLEAHVAAAVRAKAAGFQGWRSGGPITRWSTSRTPWSNQRTDQWGGGLSGRTRFSRELIERVRRACGEEFIVGLAVSYSTAYEVTLGPRPCARSSTCMTGRGMWTM